MHIDTFNNTVEYAGDIDPKTAWSILENYNESLLVDVRTKAELNYVGYPDLSSLKKTFINIEQQFFPGGNLNENFVAELEQVIIKDSPNKERHVVFLCRSGARSARAATRGTHRACSAAAGSCDRPAPEAARGRGSLWSRTPQR